MKVATLALSLFCLASAPAPATQPSRYFAIEVVDDQTGRGVPMVELKTVDNVRYYTDSAGLAAVDEPALVGHSAYFGVSSHGYEFPADGFGNRGVRLDVRPGGWARVAIHRVNVAERLYRITGAGIYRDSVLLGRPVPIREPLLNAQVVGQDSAQTAVYRGKARWFWGDTARPGYPLGHFGTAGAFADLPGRGGLDPSTGIDLHYFTGADGFSRPMVPADAGPPGVMRWTDAVTTLRDDTGAERLVARVSLMKSLGECVGRRLVVYDDAKDEFVTLADIPINAPLQPAGHALPVERDGVAYVYFGERFPDVRTRADLRSFADLSAYEGFTCLAPGTRHAKGHAPRLDRDAAGRLVWGWKKDTEPPGPGAIAELLRAGSLRPEELWPPPRDAQTRKPLDIAAASVAYNAFRHRWVAIAGERRGSSSFLGEIWYAEADAPEGPWPWARKIVTHDRYSFYNPAHDAFLDQDNGRLLYFEGTYAATFSRDGDPTPRYDYNQMMYRLDLSDPRLKLPAVTTMTTPRG